VDVTESAITFFVFVIKKGMETAALEEQVKRLNVSEEVPALSVEDRLLLAERKIDFLAAGIKACQDHAVAAKREQEQYQNSLITFAVDMRTEFNDLDSHYYKKWLEKWGDRWLTKLQQVFVLPGTVGTLESISKKVDALKFDISIMDDRTFTMRQSLAVMNRRMDQLDDLPKLEYDSSDHESPALLYGDNC
jgi:hypothetical protein